MTDKPTDEALENLFVEETGFDIDDFPAAIFGFARAVLAKWGQPVVAGEPYAYAVYFHDQPCEELVHDLDDLTEDLTNREHTITELYTTPQPTQAQAVAREPLTDEQIQDLLLCGNPTDEEMRLIRIGWDAAHGIKGGQHGTE